VKTLAAALLAAQREMPAVRKDGKGHVGNRFATINAILEAARPILNTHGIVVIQAPTQVNGFPALRTVLLHESGELFEDTMLLVMAQSTPQGQGSGLTYARRYALAAMLGLEQEDDDGAAATPKPRASRKGVAGEAGATSSAPHPSNDVINSAQRKRLWAIAGEQGVDTTRVRSILEAVTGQDSTAKIPRSKYDDVIAGIEEAGKHMFVVPPDVPAPLLDAIPD
jgi:hypothetical protein